MASVHVVVFPFPAAGHSTPFIHFAKHLARFGVAVSFIAPHSQISTFKNLLVEDERFEARRNINVVSFEFPFKGMDTALFFAIRNWMRSNADKFDEIIGQLMFESPTIYYPSQGNAGPPVCIISDMFLGFTQGIADRCSIPRYCLFSSPVHFLSFMYHIPHLHAEGRIPCNLDDEPFLIPNFPAIPPGGLPPSLLDDSRTFNSHHLFLDEAKAMWKAAGVVVNTVYTLELPVIEGLCKFLGESSPKQVPNIWTIGPVLEGLWEGETPFRERLREEHPNEAWFNWLESQPDSSVLYVSFGSVATLSDTQILELASGLENSGQRFFWVLRIPKSENETSKITDELSNFLPEGFLERTKSRGFMYWEWAPQLHILAHRATGGFLSHCGWNSTMESMSMGVPMIAMPVQGDQMFNASLIDAVLGIGVQVNKIGAFWETVGREAIEKAVQQLMCKAGDDAIAMHSKASLARHAITRAVAIAPAAGSSRTNLALFVQHLQSLGKGFISN